MSHIFNGEALNRLVWLFSLLKSGSASFFTDGIENLRLKVEKERIDLNLMNKELLTDLLKNTDARDKSLFRKLAMLKSIAQELKREGLTLTISYRDSLLLTLGSEAKPTFSDTRAFTGTDAIEIDDLKQLSQIMFLNNVRVRR